MQQVWLVCYFSILFLSWNQQFDTRFVQRADLVACTEYGMGFPIAVEAECVIALVEHRYFLTASSLPHILLLVYAKHSQLMYFSQA